jgi:AcrR family transcriptional regulator
MKKVLAAARPLKPPPKPRGRPRSFDRDKALEQAIEVFWKKGFEGTSISDLTEAMGINPPSLYAAFGDKEKLFLEAVERYNESRGESCPYCAEPTAKGAVEKLLLYMADELCSSDHPRGCMMVMAAATSSSSSAYLQRKLAEKRTASRTNLKARIEQGIRDGDVVAGTNADEIADFYSTIMTGMSLLSRDGASHRSLVATVENAMRLFPSAKKAARKAVEAV